MFCKQRKVFPSLPFFFETKTYAGLHRRAYLLDLGAVLQFLRRLSEIDPIILVTLIHLLHYKSVAVDYIMHDGGCLHTA